MPQSLLPVHVQPDFLLAVSGCYIPLRRGSGGSVSRESAELFGQIYLDRQRCTFDGYLPRLFLMLGFYRWTNREDALAE